MKIVFISHLAHSQGGAQGVLVDLIKGLKHIFIITFFLLSFL